MSLNVVTWWQNLELKCHLVADFGNMPYLFLKFVGIFVKIESYSNLFLLILGSPFPSAASPLAVGSPGMGPRPSPRGAGPLPSPHSGSGGQSSQTGNRNQVPASRLVDERTSSPTDTSPCKEVLIVNGLFLVNCYLLHVPRLPSQPASNAGG